MQPRRLGHAAATRNARRVLLLPPQPWVAGPDDEPAASPAFESVFTRLSELGFDLDILNPLGKPFNPLTGRHALYSGLDPLRALHVLLRERRYDAVMAVGEAPALLPLLLRRLAGFSPRIIAADVALAGGWAMRDRVLNQVVPRLDGLILLGRNQVAHVEARWKPRGLIRFIPLQIDTDFYAPTDFVADGPLLTVGDDVGRDYDTLLAAVEPLDIPILAKTRAPAITGSTHPRLETVSGRLNWRRYRDLIARARCVVVPLVPTIHASGVNSILEACCLGKALIVSDSPGIRDYVVPDETALVVPCGDASAMRTAIRRLMDDEGLCRRLGSAARTFVVANSSYDAVAARTADLLRAVIDRQPAANRANEAARTS